MSEKELATILSSVLKPKEWDALCCALNINLKTFTFINAINKIDVWRTWRNLFT